MSRSRAQSWIESGAVLVDGSPAVRAATRVRESAVVEIMLPDDAERRALPEPEDRPLDVLYEDQQLIAVNKPAGVVVHPSYKNTSGTVLNALLHRVRERSEVRPGIVTRLDKETSGVMLVALTAGVHARLQRSEIRKEYLAVVRGVLVPPRGTIDLALGRDQLDRRRIVAEDGGIPSTTKYEVVSAGGGLSLVRCELVTGRTHQIRVHLAARGWPIVGDSAYGVTDERIARVALHSWRVRLSHPVSGEPLEIEAPLPADIAALVGA
jgi:23S rRNA pseudouridine1911/1915/1917 synthase